MPDLKNLPGLQALAFENLVAVGAKALQDAAYQCDGPDGDPACALTEEECYHAHPVTWSAMVAGDTHVSGSVTDIARIVLEAVAAQVKESPRD